TPAVTPTPTQQQHSPGLSPTANPSNVATPQPPSPLPSSSPTSRSSGEDGGSTEAPVASMATENPAAPLTVTPVGFESLNATVASPAPLPSSSLMSPSSSSSSPSSVPVSSADSPTTVPI
ncbi:unnamed protein product, partial [Sphacelaria rigidula]